MYRFYLETRGTYNFLTIKYVCNYLLWQYLYHHKYRFESIEYLLCCNKYISAVWELITSILFNLSQMLGIMERKPSKLWKVCHASINKVEQYKP